MFGRPKFKIVNRVNLRIDVYIKNRDELLDINNFLYKKFLIEHSNVLLIEYFDDMRAAKRYFKSLTDKKVTEREIDSMEEHYIAEMNRNKGELRLYKDARLIELYP